MGHHPHIAQEKFAFLESVNVLALDYYAVKLLQKVTDGTVTVEELALLKKMVTASSPPA